MDQRSGLSEDRHCPGYHTELHGKDSTLCLYTNTKIKGDSWARGQVTQFHFWEYINWNQTFILDSHRPLQCTVRTYVQLRWVAESGRSTVGWAAVDDLKLLRTDDCMLMPHNAEPPTTAAPPTTEAPPAGPFHLNLFEISRDIQTPTMNSMFFFSIKRRCIIQRLCGGNRRIKSVK